MSLEHLFPFSSFECLQDIVDRTKDPVKYWGNKTEEELLYYYQNCLLDVTMAADLSTRDKELYYKTVREAIITGLYVLENHYQRDG